MKHGNQLSLERCPHCSVAKPLLVRHWAAQFQDYAGSNVRFWSVYGCATCGALTLACSPKSDSTDITDLWPAPQTVPEAVPARARDFLSQALASLHAPAGAVILAASAIDAMLKAKNYKNGSLNARIEQAAKDHLITAEMSAWAHEIRLDANDQRHADESMALPNEADAKKAIEFANALAQFLFVLPARVERGRKGTT